MPAQLQIFLGYPQNRELKIVLEHSAAWKEAQLLGTTGLSHICYDEKEYIGIFLAAPLTCMQIKQQESDILAKLQIYCPHFDFDKYKSYIFPQFLLF